MAGIPLSEMETLADHSTLALPLPLRSVTSDTIHILPQLCGPPIRWQRRREAVQLGSLVATTTSSSSQKKCGPTLHVNFLEVLSPPCPQERPEESQNTWGRPGLHVCILSVRDGFRKRQRTPRTLWQRLARHSPISAPLCQRCILIFNQASCHPAK